MSDIFQEIWDADQAGNGVPALRPVEPKDHTRGFVVVDERATTIGSDHRVISEVGIPEKKRDTYRLCEILFDNYALERAVREQVRPGELREELEFIDAILETPPIETARQFLELSLDLQISKSTLSAMIKETWFTLGRAGSQPDASGFEHVFVGEQASKKTRIGGYHFWYKYWLDDGGKDVAGFVTDDRIEYLGTKYGAASTPDKGVLIPEIVTLEMKWIAPVGDLVNPNPSRTKNLHKPIGGFFVGCSPEGMIAFGLVRARTQSSKMTRINGATYQLDLHRLDKNRNAIRTFFPRFVRADIIDISPGTGGSGTGGGTTPGGIDPPDIGGAAAPAPFSIIAGMINPVNPEGGREFLQILNVSDQVQSLENWEIEAPNGFIFTLADISISPGDVYKFVMPSSTGILRNRAGSIRLRAPGGLAVQEYEYTGDQAKREGQPIVFLQG
ncbi:MAG: hypothetical protein GY706_15590 [Bacteroides sp.]|nr:hypothetical protein [Bacteroides sp.]